MNSFKKRIVELSNELFLTVKREVVDIIREEKKTKYKIFFEDKVIEIEVDYKGNYYLRKGYLDDLEEVYTFLKGIKENDNTIYKNK